MRVKARVPGDATLILTLALALALNLTLTLTPTLTLTKVRVKARVPGNARLKELPQVVVRGRSRGKEGQG